jgi:hypothetical protein
VVPNNGLIPQRFKKCLHEDPGETLTGTTMKETIVKQTGIKCDGSKTDTKRWRTVSVGCPRLFRGYLSYLAAVPSIRNLSMRHAVVTSNKFTRQRKFISIISVPTSFSRFRGYYSFGWPQCPASRVTGLQIKRFALFRIRELSGLNPARISVVSHGSHQFRHANVGVVL